MSKLRRIYKPLLASVSTFLLSTQDPTIADHLPLPCEFGPPGMAAERAPPTAPRPAVDRATTNPETLILSGRTKRPQVAASKGLQATTLEPSERMVGKIHKVSSKLQNYLTSAEDELLGLLFGEDTDELRTYQL